MARILVAVIDIERIEADSRGDTPAIYFLDELGVVFFSNRSELLMMQQGQGTRSDSATYGADQLRPFFDYLRSDVQGHEIWQVSVGRYIPGRALHIEREIPVIGMRAVALVDARPAYVTAGLQASVVAAAFLLFGAVLLFTTERRRALARANEALEERVRLRTQELSETNEAMRGEIAERREAEIALKKAQDDLVQVGKLSALGQMSAGISHELNQPLMAIQSFAENGARFLSMGKSEKADQNFGRISDLAVRMARIIKNLRAFARQESEPAGQVDLCGVVRAAIEVSESRLSSEGVAVEVSIPGDPDLGARWRGSAPAGRHQPDLERDRCDERQPDEIAQPNGVGCSTAQRDGAGHGPRNPIPGKDLRAFLFDEVGWRRRGDRPRSVHFLWSGAELWGQYQW